MIYAKKEYIMALSFLTAKIIALIYLALGVGILIKRIDFSSIVDDLERSPALTFISGALGITIGMVLVEYHNLWVMAWPLLITLIGWGFLVGGIVVVLFPQVLFIYRVPFKNPMLLGSAITAFGLFIGYFGFY